MMDQPLLKALAAALRERLDVIRDHEERERDPAAHLERLREASENLERLEAQLPAGTDPRLAHFMQRRSYDKALEWLEG